MIEVATGKSVPVITPNLTYKIKRGQQEGYDVPIEITKFIDDFVVYRVVVGEGIREASFMYSLGVYCVPADQSDLNAVYLCLFNSKGRSANTIIPCAKKQCANVNKHYERHHLLRGEAVAKLTRVSGVPIDKNTQE